MVEGLGSLKTCKMDSNWLKGPTVQVELLGA